MTTAQLSTALPYKSVAAALLFTVILGPIGLLYASFWGGFIMIALGLFLLPGKLFLPLGLIWLICCIWSVGAVEAYNKRILAMYRHQQAS